MDMNLHKLTNNTSWSLDHMTMDQDQDPNNRHAHYSNWHNNYPSSSSHQLLFQDHDHHPPQMGSSSKNNHHVFEQHDDLQDQEHQQEEEEEEQEEELGAMKEMMYKIASMQPVDIDPSTIRKPKRRNVRISEDPQSVAARLRRERISEKIRILQRLVPGGTKMDTASMLDEAIRYVKFLKRQIRVLQTTNHNHPHGGSTATGGGLSSNNQDWSWLPITTSSKNVVLEDQVGFSFTHGGVSDGGETLCFNHHEVI